MRKHKRNGAFLFALCLVIAGAFAYQAGLERSLAVTVKTMAFLRDQMATMLFLAVVGAVVLWIIRLNLSDEIEAQNFKLSKLLTYPDGSPDPKKISLWIATLAGMYAFFYLLMHDRPAFTSFANWFLLTLFGYAGAIEIFKQKDPQVPGVVTETRTVKQVTEISKPAAQMVDNPDENK